MSQAKQKPGLTHFLVKLRFYHIMVVENLRFAMEFEFFKSELVWLSYSHFSASTSDGEQYLLNKVYSSILQQF